MDPFFIVVVVVVSLVAVVSVVKVALGVPADIKILGDVLGDNPEKREETARNENEAFIRLMRDSDNGKLCDGCLAGRSPQQLCPFVRIAGPGKPVHPFGRGHIGRAVFCVHLSIEAG